VMMRARHKRSLERPKASLAKLGWGGQRARKLPYANPTANKRVSDVELVEMGEKSFAWVVFTVVVEVEEEGLFRHIIEYL